MIASIDNVSMKAPEYFDGKFVLRDWVSTDAGLIAQINNSEIPNVTVISSKELIKLSKQAFHFRVAESTSHEIAGFVLALDEVAVYPSLNFQWFKSRYSKFSYIDRIVVSSSHKRRGLGRLLYEDLQKAAKTRSPILCCEINIRPPNSDSLNFHKQFGFRGVGVQETEGGKKTVSLWIKDLSIDSPTPP